MHASSVSLVPLKVLDLWQTLTQIQVILCHHTSSVDPELSLCHVFVSFLGFSFPVRIQVTFS